LVYAHPPAFDVTLADLIGALHDAFLDEFEDEELASLAVQMVLEERLVEGQWRLGTQGDEN
jgi:hypothetical protein